VHARKEPPADRKKSQDKQGQQTQQRSDQATMNVSQLLLGESAQQAVNLRVYGVLTEHSAKNRSRSGVTKGIRT